MITLLLLVSAVSAIDDNSTDINNQELNIKEYVNSSNIDDINTINKSKSKKEANNIIYAKSNGNYDSNGLTKDNPTTFNKAVSLMHNNDTIVLTTSGSTDDYTGVYISLSTAKNATQFTITADPTKKIYFGSFQIPGGYSITFNNIILTGNKTIINKGNLNLNNVTIENNNYKKSVDQSAIIYNYHSKLNINSSIISSNHGNLSGAIYSEYYSTVVINNTVFDNNTAKIGGAITSYESTLKINNSIFKNNSANVGAAICSVGDYGILNIDNTSFYNNHANDYGGAIVNWYGESYIINSNITNNSAVNTAGGLAFLGSNDTRLYNNLLADNYANNSAILQSIKTNLTANFNVIYNTKKSSWVTVENYNKTSIDNNWWGSNSPDFKTITDGYVPYDWIIFKIKNNLTKTSINAYLLNGSRIIKMPYRITLINNSNNMKTYTFSSSLDVELNVNQSIIIDDEILVKDKKLDYYIQVNDVIANVNEKATINIETTPLMDNPVELYINNQFIAVLNIKNGIVSYNYTIKSNMSNSLNAIKIVMNQTDIYNQKIVNSSLYVRYNSENISSIVLPLYEFNTTVFDTDLPSRYDARNYNINTSVKNQKSSGSCWAFSSASTLEAVLKKSTGIQFDFSVNNFKNIMKRYSFSGDTTSEPDDGGALITAINYFVTWLGPVNNTLDPYDEYSLISSQYNSTFHVQDVYMPKSKDVDSLIYNIKTAVYNQGAMTITYYSTDDKDVYNSNKYSSDHAVSVIGWDDNYSRYNFIEASTSKRPEKDGAFIVKNSWGSSWGYNGYFYLSYYDSSLYASSKYFFTYLLDNRDNYYNIYQYDSASEMIGSVSGGRWIKHNYISKENETISAVGTYFLNKSDYTVNIYVNNKLKYTQNGTINLTGYRTIQLNKQIPVNKDDLFTIELGYKNNEASLTYYIVQYASMGITNIKANQSLTRKYSQTNYVDNYNSGRIEVLKAYTKKYSTMRNTVTYDENNIIINTNIQLLEKQGKLIYNITSSDNNINKIISKEINTSDKYTLILDKNEFKEGNYLLNVKYNSGDNQYQLIENNSFNLLNTDININATLEQYSGLLSFTTFINHTNILLANGSIDVYEKNSLILHQDINSSKQVLKFNYTDNGIHTFTFKYNAYENYLPSIKNITINVIGRLVNVTIEDIGDKYPNQTVIIKGNVTSNNNLLDNIIVDLYIDNQLISTNKTINGIYQFTTKTNLPGIKNIAVITHENNDYDLASKNTSFKVIKYPTSIKLENINNDYITNNIIIKGKLLINSTGNKNIKLTINNKTLTITTDKNNNFSYVYNSELLGVNTVKIQYGGNNYYTESNKTTTFNISKNPTQIVINKINAVYVGEKIKINGKILSNVTNNKKITLKINDEIYNLNCDNNQNFSYTYKTINYGTNNITVIYDGDNYSLKSSNTSKFIVNRFKTNITLDNIKNIIVGDDIIISGKVTSENKVISNSYLLAEYDDRIYLLDITNGRYSIKLEADQIGKKTIKLFYDGNNTYENNTLIQEFTVNKHNTSITIKSPSTLYNNEESIINVTLSDESGYAVSNKNIILTVNNKSYNLKTDDDGFATQKIVPTNTNKLIITAKFNGDFEYNQITNTSTPTVQNRTFNTTISIKTNNTKIHVNDNVKITITLKDSQNKNLNKTIKVKINNKTLNLKTINATATTNYTLTKKDAYLNIITTFDGDSIYNKSYNSLSLKRHYDINMQLLTGSFDTKPGDTVKLIAHLTDNGVDIDGGQLVFKLNGLSLKDENNHVVKVNVKNGLAILEYKIPDTLSARTHNLTAVYASNTYGRVEVSTPMTINRYQTHIDINPIITNTNNIYIKAQVVDQNNKALNKQTPICIKINGISYNLNTTTGTINYKVTQVLKDGNYNISIISGANGKYLESTAKTVLIKTNNTIKTNYINNTLNTKDNIKSKDIQKGTILSILTGSAMVKPGDTLKLIAHISEDEIDVTGGQLVFKLNGLSLKDENNHVVKVNVKNGLAILEYKIPDTLSARTHNLTAVYASNTYGRVEVSTNLTMNKLNTHINIDPVYTNKDNTYIKFEILDDNNQRINKLTAVTIKIDGKSYNLNTSIGIINYKIPIKLSKGVHQINIISGDNGKYLASRSNTVLIKT